MMATLLARAKRMLSATRRARSGGLRIAAEAIDLDTEAVARELRVDRNAHRVAIGWQPADGGDLDHNERRFLAYHQTLMRRLAGAVRQELRRLEICRQADAYRMDPQRLVETLDQAGKALLGLEGTLRDRLAWAYREVVEAGRRVRAVADRYGTLEPPAELEHQGFVYIGLAAAVVFEGVANAHFFAIGEHGGLLDGFMIAALTAVVNVTTSYQAGKALRWLGLDGARRILAAVIGGAWLTGITAYHLAIGHYRAALGSRGHDGAVTSAWQTFTTSPFGIDNLQAWLLVLLGLGFAAAAAAAGFHAAEPVPGHRAALRRRAIARHAYEEIKEQATARVRQIFDDQSAALDRAVIQAREALASDAARVAEMHGLAESFEAGARAIRGCLSACMRRYRLTIQRVVGLAGDFTGEPALAVPAILDEIRLPSPRELAAEQERRMAGLDAVSGDVRRRLHAARAANHETVKALIAEVERQVEGPSLGDRDASPRQLSLWPLTNGGHHHVVAH
jgi:hypothetical protein